MLATDKGGYSARMVILNQYQYLLVKNLQGEMDCAGPLVYYAAKGHKAEFLGKKDVGATECQKLKLTLKSGRDITFYFDPKTYYIFRTVTVGSFGSGGEMKTDFSEYKKTDDGYVFPYKLTIVGRSGGFFFEKIEINKPVDEKVYKPEIL